MQPADSTDLWMNSARDAVLVSGSRAISAGMSFGVAGRSSTCETPAIRLTFAFTRAPASGCERARRVEGATRFQDGPVQTRMINAGRAPSLRPGDCQMSLHRERQSIGIHVWSQGFID